VSYTLTFGLPRDVAERLTAQAIRDGKNIGAVVRAILESEVQRMVGTVKDERVQRGRRRVILFTVGVSAQRVYLDIRAPMGCRCV
jgi:hypothetical protein